eukprot:GSChrysophyteH2.ASY1.ANO1.487.1 assembled CDS
MALSEFKDKLVSVITNDGRNIIGTLRGFDQTINVVLEKTHERIYSADQGVVLNDLGLYIVRGDNIAMIGELDSDADGQRDLNDIKAEPLKPVRWE